MAITHVVVLGAVLLALLCLPCAVAVVVCADDLVVRRGWTRHGRREIRELRHLERELTAAAWTVRPPGCELTIEQLEADLRRLAHQRRSRPTTESVRWLAAVLRAYDDRLSLAARSLGLSEHLLQLDGMDREIERVRVEGALHAAGLDLRATR